MEAGAGPAVLLLHQTPRSSDEYRAVVPRLADAGFRAIAMDTLGFGDSDRAPEPTIEAFAAGACALLDALGIERAAAVGHHTGGVVAVELAAAQPERVAAIVLSSTPYCDAAFRAERRAAGPPVDDDQPHVSRSPYYPPDRPDLLERLAVDARRATERRGHEAVGSYRMEERLPLVIAPALLVGAPEDPFAYPYLPRLAERLPGARVVEIEGGMVPLPDGKPEEFAAVVADFLKGARWS